MIAVPLLLNGVRVAVAGWIAGGLVLEAPGMDDKAFLELLEYLQRPTARTQPTDERMDAGEVVALTPSAEALEHSLLGVGRFGYVVDWRATERRP